MTPVTIFRGQNDTCSSPWLGVKELSIGLSVGEADFASLGVDCRTQSFLCHLYSRQLALQSPQVGHCPGCCGLALHSTQKFQLMSMLWALKSSSFYMKKIASTIKILWSKLSIKCKMDEMYRKQTSKQLNKQTKLQQGSLKHVSGSQRSSHILPPLSYKNCLVPFSTAALTVHCCRTKTHLMLSCCPAKISPLPLSSTSLLVHPATRRHTWC